jgi:hypothetical protein
MSEAVVARTPVLHDLCVARLRDCVDPESGLFGRQIRDGSWAPTQGTEAITSTAICLIGLTRAGIPAGEVVDPSDILGRTADSIGRQRYFGGLGLAFWAASTLRASAPLDLLARAGLDPDALVKVIPGLTTMEVAWLVSGLLHVDHPRLRPAGDAALGELRGRLDSETLVFRHASAAAPLRHRLRGRIANFADQVYPVQALAFAAIVQGSAELRMLADRCATRMAAAQGPLGQWWWHHDSKTGRVIERYPVYSVHQHSMAPMAFRCLSAAGGQDHANAVSRSRTWLQANELGLDMTEAATGIIWRSIERDERGIAHLGQRVRIALARPASKEAAPRLRLNREMRPYEWGWLLYSTAIEATPAPAGHLV